MPTVDNLDIQISATFVKADKEIDKLIAKLGRLSSSLSSVGANTTTVASGVTQISNSTARATKSFNGLASAIGKFYATYFLAIRGFKGLYNSIESTADYLEAFNFFEVSFNKIGKEWSKDFVKYGKEVGAATAEAYAESFNKRAKETLSKLSGVQIQVDEDGKGLLTTTGMKNLGLNIQEITQYASQLASVTNSVGLTGEASLRTAESFTKLAGDISSLFNIDYSSAAKNLQSGLIGQARALYKYGIDITNATLQTKAYELGLEKAVSEMTQAEKMQLRLLTILEQSKVAWGDLANTIESPSNMIRQFTNNLKEAGVMLGQLFIPLLTKVLPVLNGFIIALKNLFSSIANMFNIKLDLDLFGNSSSDIEDFTEDLEELEEASNKAKKGLRGFDELKTINTKSGSNDGLSDTIDLTEEIIKATQEYEKVWQEAYEKMEQRAQAFADKLSGIFKPIEGIFQGISVGDWFTVGQNVAAMGNNLFDTVIKIIENTDWEGIGEKFGEFFEGSMLESFKGLPKLGALITEATDGINKFLTKAIKSVDWKNAMGKFLEGIQGFLKNLDITKIVSGLTQVLNALNEALVSGLDYLMENPDEVVKTLGLLIFKIIELALTTTASSGEVMGRLFAGVLQSMFKGAMEFFPTVSNVKEWKEKFGETFRKAKAKLGNLKINIGADVEDFKTKLEPAWNKVKEWWETRPKLSQIKFDIQDMLKQMKEDWNRVKDWWKNNVKLKIPSIEFKVTYSKAKNAFQKGIVNALGLEGWPKFEFFEQGGFPRSADLFWANENGVPELVGTMGGRTAVASGTEITGISDAIYSTGQQEASLMQTMVGLLRVIADKDFGISDSAVGQSAQRYARDYFNRTGNDAYSF